VAVPLNQYQGVFFSSCLLCMFFTVLCCTGHVRRRRLAEACTAVEGSAESRTCGILMKEWL